MRILEHSTSKVDNGAGFAEICCLRQSIAFTVCWKFHQSEGTSIFGFSDRMPKVRYIFAILSADNCTFTELRPPMPNVQTLKADVPLTPKMTQNRECE